MARVARGVNLLSSITEKERQKEGMGEKERKREKVRRERERRGRRVYIHSGGENRLFPVSSAENAELARSKVDLLSFSFSLSLSSSSSLSLSFFLFISPADGFLYQESLE